MLKGECPICKKKGIVLTKHHVVESKLDENGKHPSINMCNDCHVHHEKYLHYIKDVCKIDITRTD